MLLTRFRVLEGGLGKDDNGDGVESGVNCFLGGVRLLKVIKRSFIFRFLVVFLDFLDFLDTFIFLGVS